MDQFGVLVENMGVKVHGRSAPMAKLKHKPQSHFTPTKMSPFVDSSSLPVDDLDGIFRSSVNANKTRQSQNVFGYDHIFGGSSNQLGGIDLESILISSNKNNGNNSSNINFLGSNDYVDLLGLNQKQSEPVHDDMFGIFKGNSSEKLEKKGSEVEDLLPGFGDASPSNPEIRSNGFENIHDLLSGDGVQKKHDSKHNSTAQDSPFDLFFNKVMPEVKPPPNTKKDSSAKITDDYTSLFGDVANSRGEFEEIDGEPEERREARRKRYMRMKERMDEALFEKNQRDIQSQQEQEEKRRLAVTLDYNIKCWAAGKKGNLRALLSSLEQVLWPECGWRAVSIADLMASDSVKKVYRKATLCVHPDKVQQKGANLQQKYIAEKVFDLLKEAWNKFSAEELRRI